jgi:uncharacterized protein (DUF305 family)
MNRTTKLLALGLLLLSAPANAQEGKGHDMHDMKGMHEMHGNMSDGAPKSEAAAAFAEVNAKMHKDMSITFTGDADVDFMAGMIPHHQGAIDMAQVVLKYGKDPETRKLAEEIIAAQEKEIAFMKGWLAKRAK